jgi:hypothetical protein
MGGIRSPYACGLDCCRQSGGLFLVVMPAIVSVDSSTDLANSTVGENVPRLGVVWLVYLTNEQVGGYCHAMALANFWSNQREMSWKPRCVIIDAGRWER